MESESKRSTHVGHEEQQRQRKRKKAGKSDRKQLVSNKLDANRSEEIKKENESGTSV
jgi:hypothetical protein